MSVIAVKMLLSRCTFTLSIYSVRQESQKSSSATQRWARGCVKSLSLWPVWVPWHTSLRHISSSPASRRVHTLFSRQHFQPLTHSRLGLLLVADGRYCALTFYAVHDDRDHWKEGALPPGIHGHVGQHGAAHRRALLPGKSPAKRCIFLFCFIFSLHMLSNHTWQVCPRRIESPGCHTAAWSLSSRPSPCSLADHVGVLRHP